MTEPATHPPRTWRPMAAWTAAILAALGLAWFVGVVVVPMWQARRVVRGGAAWSWQEGTAIEQLGGKAQAARKLAVYLRLMPGKNSHDRQFSIHILSHCGDTATPILRQMLSDSDETVRQAAAEALKKILGEEPAK